MKKSITLFCATLMLLSIASSSQADLIVWDINAPGVLNGSITLDTDSGAINPFFTATYSGGSTFTAGGITDFSFTDSNITWNTIDGPGQFSVTFGASTAPADLTNVNINVSDFPELSPAGGTLLQISGTSNGALTISVDGNPISTTAGFRVAGVPEPSSVTVLLAGCLTGLMRRRSRA